MSFTREKVLHHAQVEINETDGTIYGKWYKDVNNAPGFDAPGTPWCAMFASYVYSQAGDDRYPAFAYCPYWIKWLRENGYWKTSNPKPGDLVFFDFDGGESDHVAIVEKINSNGTIGVIEGNSAQGNVKRTDYNTNVIVGYSHTTAMYFGEVEQPQAPQEPVVPTPPTGGLVEPDLPGDFVVESGKFTCTEADGIHILKAPSLDGEKTGLFYNYGESVYYEGYVNREGCIWITWISASTGERRWMAVREMPSMYAYGTFE